MKRRKALCFDDILLVPNKSSLTNRKDADLGTFIAGIRLKIPLVSANMQSITETEMIKAIGELGGLPIVHRFCSVQEQADMINSALFGRPWFPPNNPPDLFPVGFSFGIGDDWLDRVKTCYKAGAKVACLDVAHAHHNRVLELLPKYFNEIQYNFDLPFLLPLIIGNVATVDAVKDILNVIPELYHKSVAIKASIGGGSLCTTRVCTGFGVPTLQAIIDIAGSFPEISLISDGGHKNSGDIVKALALGADAVMLGSLLSATDETPGRILKGRDGQLYKEYAGSASQSAKELRGEKANVEGDSCILPYKGPVKRVVEDLLDGIRSGFSYGGSRNILELQENIDFVEISSQGYRENLPHALF